MRLTIVGTGYVGLVTGTCLANTGNVVTCLDIDEEKIRNLRRGICPIHEMGLETLIARNVKAGRLLFTIDKEEAYQDAEVVFICVGTPPGEDGQADLSFVRQVARDIGDAMEGAPGATGGAVDERRAKIIVVKSTVPVGTNTMVRSEIASRTDKPFRMASNPEFLKEGQAVNNFNKPDRVVLGVEDKGTGDRLRDLYNPFVRQGNPIFIMDIASAEMVKYASNTMLATKISFINEIANLCEEYGADIDEVRLGMCSDKRIGNQFLYPGLGYGGSCFPKDVQACINMGERSENPATLLRAVDGVNQRQRQRFLNKIDQHFGEDLTGKRIAVWGLAFKPGTDDMRDAPSVTIIEHLLDRGAEVVAYDPVAADGARKLLGDRITYAEEEMSAMDGAHALIICTDWDEFKHPDLDIIRTKMSEPVIFDGRNLYALDTMREHGFTYHSIGRPSMTAAPLPKV